MSRRGIALLVALITVVAGSFAVVEAAPQDVKGAPTPQGPANTHPVNGGGGQRPQALGTIIYDDGNVTHVAGTEGTFGNRFNTASGAPVLFSGSVTRMSFYMYNVAGSAFVSVYGPVNGTTAPSLGSFLVPATSGAFNTHTFASPINYGGASFLAGVWCDFACASTIGAGDQVALGTGTSNGQGYHAMFINDISGTGYQPITLNALVGASGNVLIPVELMGFEIE